MSNHVTTQPLPAPHSDEGSFDAIDEAIAQLGSSRGVNMTAEGLLHVVASLIEQAQRCLPMLVAEARSAGASWTEIAQLLGTNPIDARAGYDPDSATADTRIPFNI